MISVMSENLSLIYEIVSNSLLKTGNFIKNVLLINFFATQFLVADISFNIARKELKNAQIAQVNQLFQLLNLVCIQWNPALRTPA